MGRIYTQDAGKLGEGESVLGVGGELGQRGGWHAFMVLTWPAGWLILACRGDETSQSSYDLRDVNKCMANDELWVCAQQEELRMSSHYMSICRMGKDFTTCQVVLFFVYNHLITINYKNIFLTNLVVINKDI